MGSCAPCPPCPPLPHAALQHSWTLSAQTLGLLAQSIPAEVLGHPPCPLHALGHRRGKKGQHGAVLGRGWVSPHPQEQDGARSHSLQGSGFQELSWGHISEELSTQHSRGGDKPGPQGANPSIQNTPEKHSQPHLFSLPHTLQHISFPPQRGERYTSMILFHFSC